MKCTLQAIASRRGRLLGSPLSTRRQAHRRPAVQHPAPTPPMSTETRRWRIGSEGSSTQQGELADLYSKTVTVGSAVGLHARPAAVIAEAVGEADVPVTLSLDGDEPVDAGSALMIMTLGAGKGAQVTVASEDEAACNRIAELVEQDLDA